MGNADSTAVLAGFDNSSFTHGGTWNYFFTKGEKYFVDTIAPHGQYLDFEIRYIFGVSPLQ